MSICLPCPGVLQRCPDSSSQDAQATWVAGNYSSPPAFPLKMTSKCYTFSKEPFPFQAGAPMPGAKKQGSNKSLQLSSYPGGELVTAKQAVEATLVQLCIYLLLYLSSLFLLNGGEENGGLQCTLKAKPLILTKHITNELIKKNLIIMCKARLNCLSSTCIMYHVSLLPSLNLLLASSSSSFLSKI